MKDTVNIIGTDNYEEIQEMYLDMSYGYCWINRGFRDVFEELRSEEKVR